MIDAAWFHRLQQSLEYAVGFELFLFVGPGSYAERGLARLAKELARFGPPRWHALDREGLDGLLAGSMPGALHLVHGLERLPQAAARGLVARLNVNRRQLREIGAPVLFWVPERFYEEFVRQAPDLVAWRSQVDTVSVVDFEGESPGREPPSPRASGRPSRVFISYSHESEPHGRRVLELAQRLRADGVDAWLDRFEPAPPQGWVSWVEQQVARADFVVVICTATLRRRFERGHGWEAMLARMLDEGHLDVATVTAIVFEDSDDSDVPLMLQPAIRFMLPDDYATLLRHLTKRSTATLSPLDKAPVFAGMPDSPDLAQQLATLEHELQARAARGKDVDDLRKKVRELRRSLRAGPNSSAGDILDDRYRLIEAIGHGGFARVWKAYDTETESVVAVKILHGAWAEDRSMIERFHRGARVMAELRHPAIVQIHAPVQASSDRRYFFVMEWLPGGDLRQAVNQAKLGRDAALLACARAFEGLTYAHERGVVHRDVKPSNILLDIRDQGVLTDFDLAWESETTHGTRTGAGLGTFVYAAPEQLSDARSVDLRADLYSAAMCVLFVLLGKDPPPLPALTEPQLFAQLPCTASLREAIVGALAYRPDDRATTGARLVAATRDSVASLASASASPSFWVAKGTDEFGRWATLRVGEVEQRMRWIEPGTFVMGSPGSEAGRSDAEGPQHAVTLTHGFWLADTPCTQALWTEVTADNPSHFRSSDRPVERVSWDDVQRFFDELTRRVTGPSFGLPSEAQWEYACRAGTATARYAEVDASAWYWHNSGGTTHPVAKKQPNSWGLHDMLGNVWEWCADGPRAFASVAVLDPIGRSTDQRACRGGSWGDDARFARAACRISYEPSYRYGSVGFRLFLAG